MDYSEQREREYQKQIVALFKDTLSYGHLGNLQYARGASTNSNGVENSPFMERECRAFLTQQLSPEGKRRYTPAQIDEAVRQIRQALPLPDNRPGSLVDINTSVYGIMINGIKARPSPNETEKDVMFFDFANPLSNHFAIAEEVSYIDRLTGSNARPDLVVYVNGFALAVIELKRSLVSIDEAIKQHLSNQCDLIPSFFSTTQFTVAASDTNGFQYATINTPKDFWCSYRRDTNKTGVNLTDRESFADFFEKKHFIEFFRYGVLTDGGIKKVMRPHQFHALRQAIPRLREKSSGVIWHSQGSGKSLTMVWVAAYIRANFEDPRVVVLTDRKELDKQIASNFTNTGDSVHCQENSNKLLETLNGGTEWLICSLIHKFGRRKTSNGGEETGNDDAPIPLDKYLEELKEIIAVKFGKNFKAKGKNIFVFIDECHRTQGGRLHEAMRAIMGQDVMLVGFTGTPLLKKDKKVGYAQAKDLSEVKFGPYIHKYLQKQAVEDKVILDLQYEGRDVEQQISDKKKLDEKKDAITQGLDEERRKAIEDRWATLERIYSSRDRIERIGYSILDDMDKYPLNTSWCNAILVAGNIESAYKYYDFFQNYSSDSQLKNHCAVVTSYEPTDYDMRKKTSNPVIEVAEKFKHDMAKQSFADAGQKNATAYEAWAKDVFVKKPGQMKLIIVVEKLLTGFDAPCATYLYIDREMKDHDLFQAICRVNRLGMDVKNDAGGTVKSHKEWGKIVDFKHLFKKITDAVTDFNDENGGLGGFSPEDVTGLLTEHIEKGRRKLLASEEAYDALKATWHGMGRDELVNAYLADHEGDPAKERRQFLYKITAALIVAYANMADYMGKAGFTSAQSESFHAKAAEARTLNLLIQQKSGDYFDPHEKDPEMRALFDRFIKADEAEVIVPATADFSFLDLIDDSTDPEKTASKAAEQTKGNAKASAEIIEGKARAVINSYKAKDPKVYETFSERLQQLLDEMRLGTSDYGERMRKLIELIKQTKSGGMNFPEGIVSPFSKALWNNREKWCYDGAAERDTVQMIFDIDDIFEYDAQEGWENPASPKSDSVKKKLQQLLPKANGQGIYYIYTIAVQNRRHQHFQR
jgi:type I restriction enzyme R subunit